MKNIVLVGFMGTGKTTVGKILSEQVGMPLLDMDALIEERAGKSINDIFANEGESGFRKRERALVQELAAKENQVISTGGGIVLNPDNLTDFESNGLLVCLLADAETIFERVQHDTTRPLLAGDKKSKVLELMEQRRPYYEAITHCIDTSDNRPPAQIAREIIDLYESIYS